VHISRSARQFGQPSPLGALNRKHLPEEKCCRRWLACDGGVSLAKVQSDTPPSQASHLPHWICGVFEKLSDQLLHQLQAMTEPRRLVVDPPAENDRRGGSGFHHRRVADVGPVQQLHRGRYQRHAHPRAHQADGGLQLVGPLRHLEAQPMCVEQRNHMVGVAGARVAGVEHKWLCC